MQVYFATNIYVNFMSDFVSQTLKHCNFFSIRRLFKIFMENIDQLKYFSVRKNVFDFEATNFKIVKKVKF